MKTVFHNAAMAAMLLVASATSHATLLTTEMASGARLNFDSHPTQEFTLGPVGLVASNGQGVTYTGTNPSNVAGFSAEIYGLGENGNWRGQSFLFSNGDGDGGRLSTLRLTFDNGPVSFAGGFLNYVLTSDTNPYYDSSVFAIRALGADGAVLEEHVLEATAPIRTPVVIENDVVTHGLNDGAFRGIGRASADIYAFEIRGGGVLRDLQFSDAVAAPVPEPAAPLLFAMGGLLAWAGRRHAARRG